VTIDSAIQNVGEYYAAHYLAEQFPKDIADQLKTWKGQSQPSQSPPRRLQALGDAYFRAKGQALDYADPTGRSAADGDLGDWHGRLLTALGYAAEPFWLELEGDRQVLPALLRLNRHGHPWLAVLETPFCLSDGELPEEPLDLLVGTAGQATARHLPAHDTGWPLLAGDPSPDFTREGEGRSTESTL
jgi:hypothetical protein